MGALDHLYGQGEVESLQSDGAAEDGFACGYWTQHNY